MRKLSLKQERFIEQYITNGGNATRAVMDAGYKCKDNNVAHAIGAENLLKLTIAGPLALRKAEIRGKTEDRRAKRLAQLDNIIDGQGEWSKASLRDRLKALELQAKMCAWLSETHILETNSRQNELNEADRQEAQQLAVLRFNPKYALPPVESEIVDPGGNGESVEASSDIIESNEVDYVQGQEQTEGSGEDTPTA